MNDEQHIDELNGKALDIVDEGKAISAASLELVNSDESIRQGCRNVLELKAAVRMAAANVDVEKRLKTFRRRVNAESRWGGKARLATIIVAAAAAFTGLVFLLNRPAEQPGEEIFTAVADAGTVTLTDNKGDEVPIRQAKTQTYTISVADYRKVMTDERNVEKVLVNVPTGKTAQVDLPDGSVAMLHPGSRLRFPTAFVGDKRFVILEGEAYFKVKKDPSHPFIVQAGDIETTVLGTEFNITGSTVTLVSGSVKVKEKVSQHSVVMTPGQQVSLIADKFKVAEVDTLPYVYWRDGYIYYDNMTISDIMKAIGSTYNMSVRCMNSEVMQQRMRFMAERDKGVDAALEMMNRMGKVRVFRKDNLIFVE